MKFYVMGFGKHRIFLGHSPRESRGHCESENKGAATAYGRNFRSEKLLNAYNSGHGDKDINHHHHFTFRKLRN